ncbi:MAG: hypothetical protein LBL59_11005 [Xanthomonadaceae bacterium]|jgi:hypothetical protein|nr:hypothetical protein [Xanthomonadaceae bacterium]
MAMAGCAESIASALQAIRSALPPETRTYTRSADTMSMMALALGRRRMARHNAIIRRLPAMEKQACPLCSGT